MTIKIVNGGALIITGEYHTPPTGVQGGPQTLSFKDWKKDENGYNFKLTTGDDILKRVDIFKDNILTLKDDINIGGRQYTINLLDEYWSNKEWKSNKSAFFENVLLELEALSNNSVINNRTLLYIPWNIHFIVIKELNYDFNLKSVDLTPESISDFDAVVLITDHDDFDYEMIIQNSKLVIDTNSCLANSNRIPIFPISPN